MPPCSPWWTPAASRASERPSAPVTPAMAHLQRSALVDQAAERLFDLIEQAEHYPQFIPWCRAVTLLERSDRHVAADLHVDLHGLRFTLGTRNTKQRPDWMTLALVRGPFRHFDGRWSLHPLGAQACRIGFELDYAFDASLATHLAAPLFARAADTLVDAFVRRAGRPG